MVPHAKRGQSQVDTAVVDWLEKRSAASWAVTNAHHAAFSPDVELAEVLKRSILFPPVLRQGEGLIKFEYPNLQLFCMDAAFYAGRAMGLTWAMDRPALHQHKLYWMIEGAGAVFDECLKLIAEQFFAGEIRAAEKQQSDDHEEIIERIMMLQNALRQAQLIKYKERKCSFTDSRFQAAQANINSCNVGGGG